MKIHRLLLPSLLALPALWSQGTATPPATQSYIMVTCLKLVPGTNPADVNKFHNDYTIPLYRATMELNPRLRRFVLQRNAVPGGTASECDYRSARVYAGWGGEPARLTAEILQKAGLTISVDDYFAKRRSLYTLVRTETLRSLPGHGDMKKGDWMVTNFVKIAPGRFAEYLANGSDVWQPYNKELIQQGKMAASFRAAVGFVGSEAPYNAVGITVYSKWDQIVGDPTRSAIFSKVHPGKSLEQVLRTGRDFAPTVRYEIDQVIELVDSKQATPTLASGN